MNIKICCIFTGMTVLLNNSVYSGSQFDETYNIKINEESYKYETSFEENLIQLYWEINVQTRQTPDMFLLADNEVISQSSSKYEYNLTSTDIFLKIANVSKYDLSTQFALFANNSFKDATINLTYSISDRDLCKTNIKILAVTETRAVAVCEIRHLFPVKGNWYALVGNTPFDTSPNKVEKEVGLTKSYLYLPTDDATYICGPQEFFYDETMEEKIEVKDVREGLEIFGHDAIDTVDAKTQKLVTDPNTNLNLTCGSSLYNHTDKVQWARHNLENDINDTSLTTRNAVFSTLQSLNISDNTNETYFCKAWTTNGTLEYKKIKIEYTGQYRHSSSTSGYFATAIVLAVLVIIALAVFFTFKIHQFSQLKKELDELYKAGLANFEKGALQHLNPNLNIEEQADLLPYDKNYEITSENLKLGEQIGSGAFGVVLKGEAKGILENNSSTPVAVKMVNRTVGDIYIKALASELKIMIYLGKHVNIVNLLGACTNNIAKKELLVVVEYCLFGNLKDFLYKRRETFIDQINSDSNENGDLCVEPSNTSSNQIASDVELRSDCRPVRTGDLFAWSYQIACGMSYLSSRKVIHGDLAARNILLTDNNVVKISDFGLSRKMYQADIYKKTGDEMLPVKWMALEAITDKVFSIKSDVWSYGVVVWEIFSLAKSPYPGIEFNEEFCDKLSSGYRMKIPQYATQEIYEIMLHCWQNEPSKRPSFSELSRKLGAIIGEPVRDYYICLNDGYLKMNAKRFGSHPPDYLAMKGSDGETSKSLSYINIPQTHST